MNAADWKAHVADGGCILCLKLIGAHVPANLHHPREGEGLGQRASDFLSIALCKEHHQGNGGWHHLGKRGFYMRYLLDELDLLALTIEHALKRLP